MIKDTDKKILYNAVIQAGNVVLERQNEVGSSKITKSFANDFGVQADLDSEQILFDALSQVEFNHSIKSEEAGQVGNINQDFIVIVDPLDGTVNYAKHIPTFCISVAVYTRSLEPVYSVVYAPHSNEIFLADGMEFWYNGQPVVRKERIGLPFVNFEGTTSPRLAEFAEKMQANNTRFRMMGCGVLGLSYTAMGRGDAALILDNKPWDVATGLHFAKCMGLIATSLTGEKVDLSQENQSLVVYSPSMEAVFSYLLV